MREQDSNQLADNPYLLLTPGPLTTTKTVKAAMMRDWCTWDDEYNSLVQSIRGQLVELAQASEPDYTSVLMQGSGTFGVEATIGTAVPDNGKLLVLVNGAYGERIAQIADTLRISYTALHYSETAPADPQSLEEALRADPQITHVAFVHTETTTGMLNPLEELAAAVKRHGKILIVDAMSSFGGIPIDMPKLDIDFLVSSANKCIQGVPGFSFVIARTAELAACKGRARSLSLDLHDQWDTMERQGGKWRYTSPTHVVRAFARALQELAEEGGISARHRRYSHNQRLLAAGMEKIGFIPLLPAELQSPIITSFRYPADSDFSFKAMYKAVKSRGFVLYPGKITSADTFRVGTIGDVHEADVQRLLEVMSTLKQEAKS